MTDWLRTWYKPCRKTNKATYGFFRKMPFLNSTLKERLSRITGLTLCTRNLASQKRHRWSTLAIKSYSVQTRDSLRFLPKRCRKVPISLPLSLPVWKCRDNLLSSPLTIWKNYASPPLSVMLLSSLRHSIMSIPKKSVTHTDWKDWKKSGTTATRTVLPATSTCRTANINCKSNPPTATEYGWTISALYPSTYCPLSGRRAGHGCSTLFSSFSLRAVSYMYFFIFIGCATKWISSNNYPISSSVSLLTYLMNSGHRWLWSAVRSMKFWKMKTYPPQPVSTWLWYKRMPNVCYVSWIRFWTSVRYRIRRWKCWWRRQTWFHFLKK